MDRIDLPLGPLEASCLVVVLTFVVYLWYSSRKQTYWREKGLPYPKPLFFFGTVLEGFTKPTHDVEKERYDKYGRIYGHFEGNKPVLSVGDPALLRDILVKDFQFFANRRDRTAGNEIMDNMLQSLKGEDWKRVRTIITPTFTTGKIKRVMHIFKDCANTLKDNLLKAVEKSEPVDIKRLYGAFTMDVIASSAFSTKIDSHNDPTNKFVANARKAFFNRFNWRLALLLLFPRLMKIFNIPFFAAPSLDFFKEVTLQIIEERKRTSQTRNDFLQFLLDTSKELVEEEKLNKGGKDSEDIASNYGNIDNDQVIKNTVVKKNLSLDELVAQCVVFFLAGYDTTGSTLSFASYFLALNPDVQERIIKELDEALAATKGDLTYEAVQNLKYLDNAISETLRLYPPAVKLERIAEEDYKLGNTGIVVPKNMIITVPAYAMQRDPEFFPDPERFDPDRFSPEERSKRDQYTYLPFGAGPRNCVGMRFALMEVKVCLAYILSYFRIKRCPQTKVPLKFLKGQHLIQAEDVTVSLEIRTDGIRAH